MQKEIFKIEKEYGQFLSPYMRWEYPCSIYKMKLKKITPKLMCLGFLILNSMTVFAYENNEASLKLIELLNILMGFVQKAGFALIAFGLGKMVLAFKDDNADAKAKGSMVLLGGVFCVLVKVILQQMGALPD